MPETLADRYRRMPDERLLQLAHSDAAGLEPEALALLRAELEARGIDRGADAAIEIQTAALSEKDAERLAAAVRARPRPVCGSTEATLNAAEVATTMSYLRWTTYRRRLVLACPACIRHEARQSSIVSALFGWWAFPMGMVLTVRALIVNRRASRRRF